MVWHFYTLSLTSTIPVFKLQMMVVQPSTTGTNIQVPHKKNRGTKHILQFLYCKKTTSQNATVAMAMMNQFFSPKTNSLNVWLRTEGLSRHTQIANHILNVSISHHHVVWWFHQSLNPMLGIITNIHTNPISNQSWHTKCCEYHWL